MHMKLSELNGLLLSRMSVVAFAAAIAPDMVSYERGLAERGRSMPISVDEDQDLFVSPNHIAILCRLFDRGQLSLNQLSFIADALQLAERVEFTNESVADLVSELTDPEINGVFTKARAFEIAEAHNA
jgi:hypothetical protein